MPPLMLERQVEVDVACSVEQVYDLWDNLENVPRWMPLVKSVKPIPGEPTSGAGSLGCGFPSSSSGCLRLNSAFPDQFIAWQSVSGLRNQGKAEFAPSDRGCRLRLTLAFALPGGLVGHARKNWARSLAGGKSRR
jgi:uncharacterized membrane protein